MIEKLLSFLDDFGAWGLFIHSFADAVIFPIPAFFLQVSLSMVDPSSALWLATVGYIACMLGTPFGYLIGKTVGGVILEKLLKKKWTDAATAMFQKNGEAAILIGAFTPIPFKVFTILSGSLKYPLWRLMVYASIGRAAKFYVVGILFYMYGRAAEHMVQDASLYTALIAIPIIVVFLVLNKRRKRKLAAQKAAEQEQLAGQTAEAQPEAGADASESESSSVNEAAQADEAEVTRESAPSTEADETGELESEGAGTRSS